MIPTRSGFHHDDANAKRISSRNARREADFITKRTPRTKDKEAYADAEILPIIRE